MVIVEHMLKCGVVSAGVALILEILGKFNCVCQIFNCNCNFIEKLSDAYFRNILLFCVAGGMIIGLIWGIVEEREKAETRKLARRQNEINKAREQSIRRLEEVRQNALNINNVCKRNKDTGKSLVSTDYLSNLQMEEIIYELTKAAELQGKVDSIADELSKKGGI